jgi:hypothetical protein
MRKNENYIKSRICGNKKCVGSKKKHFYKRKIRNHGLGQLVMPLLLLRTPKLLLGMEALRTARYLLLRSLRPRQLAIAAVNILPFARL